MCFSASNAFRSAQLSGAGGGIGRVGDTSAHIDARRIGRRGVDSLRHELGRKPRGELDPGSAVVGRRHDEWVWVAIGVLRRDGERHGGIGAIDGDVDDAVASSGASGEGPGAATIGAQRDTAVYAYDNVPSPVMAIGGSSMPP